MKKSERHVSLENETSLLEISVYKHKKGNQSSSVEEETALICRDIVVSLLKSIKAH